MDFIKKNWSRLSLALLFLLGGILGIAALTNGSVFKMIGNAADFETAFYWLVPVLSIILFFFGMATIMIIKSCASKKVVSILYMVMGGLITLLNVIVLCVATKETSLVNSLEPMASYYSYLMFYIPLFVFGLYPLIKGITRFIEAERTPAPAKVAVKTETVVHTEAPKTVAKTETPKTVAKTEAPAKAAVAPTTTVKKATVKKTTTSAK